MISVWLIYLFTRLNNLTLLPVFTDEANYIDWGWRELNLPYRYFYSLYDGKQPFLMWIFGLSQKIFSDPLFAGRIVSVITGAATLWGIYKLGGFLYDKSAATIACLVYSLIPIFVLFDRQALMESSLAAVGIWSLYFLYRYLDVPKRNYLYALGCVLGIGFFIKSSALLFLVAAILILIIKLKTKSTSPILVMLGTFLFVNVPLFFQSTFWQSIGLNGRYGNTFFGYFIKNLLATIDISFWQLTPLIFGLLIFSFFKKTHKENILFAWVLTPLIFSIFFANFIVSRYLVLFLPPLVLLLPKFNKALIFLSLIPASLLTVLQISNPIAYFSLLQKVSPYSYIEGYVTHEASGYEVLAAKQRIRELAQGQDIALGLALYSGNPESGLLIYFRNDPHVLPAYFDAKLFDPKIINQYSCLKFKQNIILASRSSDKAGLGRFFDDFEVITNPISDSKIYLSKLKTDCVGKTLELNLQRE